MADFLIRRATMDDVEEIRRAHRKSILELAAADYPPEIVAEWGTNQSLEAIARQKESIRADEELVWVAEINDKIEGFAILVPQFNELRAVYVTGAAAKKGIGSAFLKILELWAKEMGLGLLRLHSSITARQFYEKNGYTNLGESLHQKKSGRKMRCFIMEKKLSQ